MADFDLVDMYHVDHPMEMWTWAHNSPSNPVRSYLDIVLVRKVDVDFVSCPVFHLYSESDHKLLTVTLRLGDRPRLAAYWKFNISVLEIRDYREQLELLLKLALVRKVIDSKLWGTFKFRIRDFTIKYCQRLALDKAARVKAIEDRLIRVVERGDSLAVDLARWSLEREASECYQGNVVRTRLESVQRSREIRHRNS